MADGLTTSGINVKFGVDLSGVKSGISEFKSTMTSTVDATQGTTEALKQLGTAFNPEQVVSAIDVAQAKLTLLQDKVTEAADAFQQMQERAAAGEEVPGLDVAAANLTLLQAKAQDAATSLEQLQQAENSEGESAESANNASTSLGDMLGILQEKASGLTDSFAGIQEGVGNLAEGVTGLGGNFMDFANNLMMNIMNLQMMGQIATQTASSLLGPAMSAETMKTSFITLMGSTQAATDELQKLDDFAAKTPFKTMDIDQAASQLIGFGINAQNVIPDITAIGDALSAVGRGSAANLDSIVNIFGKIQTGGKLSVGIMQELSTDGINAWDILEKQTGKTQAQLTSMIQGGLLPAKTAMDDLTKGIEANPLYAGGMAKQSATMAGLISTLKSDWDQLLASFGSPIIKSLEGGINNLGNAIASPTFKSFASIVGQGIAQALKTIGNIIDFVVKGFQDFEKTIDKISMSGFIANLKSLGKSLEYVFEIVGGTVHSFLAQLSDAFSSLAGPAGSGISLFRRLGDTFWSVGDALHNFANFLSQINWSPLAQALAPLGKALLDVGGAFFRVWEAISPVGDAFQKNSSGVSKFNEVIKVVADFIKGAIVPTLENFAKILKDITPFLHNLSSIIETIAGGALLALVTGLGNLLKFLNSNSLAAEIARDVLIGLGVAIAAIQIGLLIAALPPLIVSFFSLAAAVFAATWPLLAIGAVITAVVAIVILVINHWGDITKWLQGVWQAFSAWFMNVLNAIGGFFSNIWNGIVNFFKDIWNKMVEGGKSGGKAISDWWGNFWKGVQNAGKAAWDGIVNIVKLGLKMLFDIIVAPFVAIGQLFVWLYNHNYYFQALVDNIVKFFKGLFAWLSTAWQATIAWLVGAWQGIVTFATNLWKSISDAISNAVKAVWNWLVNTWNTISAWLSSAWHSVVDFASKLWNDISKAIQSGFNAAIGFVSSIWNSISSFFVNAWNNYIAKPLTSMWNNVVHAFASAWDAISKPLGDLWNKFSKWIGDLATKAIEWGGNVIKGFITGIQNMLSGIGNALENAAKVIARFLGFHSPTKEGPGSEADKWAPNFINMYSSGLIAGIPKIKDAVNKLMSPISVSLNPTQLTATASQFKYPQSSLAASQQTQVQVQVQPNDIYIDGMKLTAALGPYIVNQIRLQGGIRKR